MTALANGAQPFAAHPGSESRVPYGDPEVGAEAPPPPPPALAAAAERIAEYQRLLDAMGELMVEQAERLEQVPTPSKPAKKPSQTMAKLRGLPSRYAVPLCIAGATLVSSVAIARCTPRLSADQITANAAAVASAQAEQSTRAELNQAAASNTQIVVPDPFAAYGLDLTEDAKTAIGVDPSTGGRTLNPKRSAVVAAQVRSLVAAMPLLTMRLVSLGPTELRVTDDKSVGYPLFKAPVPTGPASLTPTTTATSAP